MTEVPLDLSDGEALRFFLTELLESHKALLSTVEKQEKIIRALENQK